MPTITYPDPVGFGDFEGGAVPGEGTGANETTAQVDIRLGPLQSVWPRIACRVRQVGFSHGMAVQDILDAIGGVQSNTSAGGLRPYAITTGKEAWRYVGIAGEVETATGALSHAVHEAQAWQISLADTDQVSPIPDDANIYKFSSGSNGVLFVKGDGRLVSPRAKRWWTPALVSGHPIVGADSVGYYTLILDRVLFNGLFTLASNTYTDALRVTLPAVSGGPWAGGGAITWRNSGRNDSLLVDNAAASFTIYDNLGVAAQEKDYSGKAFYFKGQYFTT